MPAARTCSECGGSLAGKSPKAKTCGDRCRAARARRKIRDARREEEISQAPQHIQELTAQVRREAPSVIDKVMREELRPIVREALTEDVIRAIDGMLKLTPRAIELIAADMEDEDPLVRQKAYTLLMKYTTGHPALIQANDTNAGSQINVSFELPRPSDTATHDAEAVEEAEVEEEDRTCDICESVKPVSQFVSDSSRCIECFEKWKATINTEFAQRTAT